METNFQELYELFINIKRKRWIKSQREGSTGVGYTFESLINKKEDNQRKPDFKGIEIKTMKYLTSKKIHLFSMAPDGDVAHPIKEVLSTLGYPDKNNKDCKVFNVSITGNEYSNLGYYKRLKLFVNWKKEKIELQAYHTIKGNYKLKISWSFKELKKIFDTKLNQLAIVKACYKRIQKEDYFYYNNIEFYEKRSFEDFLKLVEAGKIPITFKLRIQKDLKTKARIHDRGTDFSIQYEDIPLLFKPVNTSSKTLNAL